MPADIERTHFDRLNRETASLEAQIEAVAKDVKTCFQLIGTAKDNSNEADNKQNERIVALETQIAAIQKAKDSKAKNRVTIICAFIAGGFTLLAAVVGLVWKLLS